MQLILVGRRACAKSLAGSDDDTGVEMVTPLILLI